ncbi:MAG: hypothetical protein H0X46_05680 [Bacteroidetes bacterium]|nr:hypothetical protein [Bacteroidota bacterium]
MAETREEVIIDFVVNYDELTNAQEQLAKSGKIDATQFASLNKALKTTATDTQGLISQFKKVATTATQLGKSVENAFGAGVQDALDEAGVSAKEFSDALTKANTPAKSLKAELRELKEALALMKANGKDAGAEFETLRARAGQLADAMSDANAEIKNAGSDTRNIDNVVGSISALAGGFAAAQGAAALFGNENEDVQKALLKVNGAMALASGIQQFYNATLKEGALRKLADSTATGFQTAAQKIYTLVTGQATAATVAFKVALAATGIGAILLLITGVIYAMKSFGDETDTTTQALDRFSLSLERSKDALTDEADLVQLQTDRLIEYAKQRGASDDEIGKLTIQRNKVLADSYVNSADKQISKSQELAKTFGVTLSGSLKSLDDIKQVITEIEDIKLTFKFKDATEEQKARLDKVLEGFTAARDALKKANDINNNSEITGERNKTDAILKSIQKQKEAREKAEAEAKAERARVLQDELAALERRLLAVEKNTQSEVDIQKLIVAQKAKIDLNAEKLKANQIALIKERSLSDQLNLQSDFNKKLSDAELQAQVDTNAAVLAGIGLNNQERLRLSIENVNATALIEINAAEGNAAKILLIEAKKYSDIRALKIAAIDKDRADQIAADAGSIQRFKNMLLKIAADTKADVNGRVAAIRTIERQELISNQNEIDDTQRKFDEKLISEQDYNAQLQKLADARVAIDDDATEKVAEIRKADAEARKADIAQQVQEILEVAGKVVQFYENISALSAEKDRQRIEEQKRALDALVEAGAISEKNARIRAQQIEIAERQARQRAAEREKRAAVFNALLAIPQAVLQGLTKGGPVLAAIYGALAAANAALVIARPVPKFFRGKKDKYEGPGVVADMGSEIVERNGRMFLYTKPTQTYLGRNDKVYTAAETRKIMHNTNLNTTVNNQAQEKFDYERLAKMIPQPTKVHVDVNKDFIRESVAEGMQITNYFDKRYKF